MLNKTLTASIIIAVIMAGLAFWQHNEAAKAKNYAEKQTKQALKTQSLF
jgi:high-affinity Fe2+/Pb2+ permease